MRVLRNLSVLILVVGAFFVFSASNALASSTTHSQSQAASLYRPFPEGIDQYNAQTALSQVMSRASWDDQYGRTIAQQTGATSFDSAQYSTLGYASRAPAGTTNSGLSGSGSIVPVADHAGSQFVKVLLVMNIVTKQTVSIMVRCGNPRLHPFVKVLPWKPFSKGTIVYVNRSVTKPVSIACPSGQSVTGTVTATVKGTIRARTWGKVQGNLDLQLQQAVELQVKVFATLKCGATPPPPPAVDVCPNLEGVQPEVPPGYVLVNGQCVPPAPPTAYACTGIVPSNVDQTNKSATLTAVVPAGAPVTGTNWTFGDSTSTHTGGNVTTHSWTQYGVTYTVTATLSFTTGSPAVCSTTVSFTAPTTPTPPPPAPKPTVICILNGVPQFIQPPGFIINGQGICVAQQQTQVVCTGNQITIKDTNGVAIACQEQQQQQTQNNNQTVVVVIPPLVVPPPVTPPAAQPPSLSNATQPQEVFANGETYPNICVTASGKNGNNPTVGFGAQFGSMSPSSTTFTSGGVNTVCSTYKAPNTPDAAGRTETITFTVHDNTTGLNGNTLTVSFPIKAPPARP